MSYLPSQIPSFTFLCKITALAIRDVRLQLLHQTSYSCDTAAWKTKLCVWECLYHREVWITGHTLCSSSHGKSCAVCIDFASKIQHVIIEGSQSLYTLNADDKLYMYSHVPWRDLSRGCVYFSVKQHLTKWFFLIFLPIREKTVSNFWTKGTIWFLFVLLFLASFIRLMMMYTQWFLFQ